MQRRPVHVRKSAGSSAVSAPESAAMPVVASIAMPHAQSDIGQNREASCGEPVCHAALLQAQPYRGVTMLFDGAIRTGQDQVKVLVDSGSSHCVSRPGLIDPESRTGRAYSVAFPAGQNVSRVPEGNLIVTIQGVTTSFTACEMRLPEGVDIMLGQSWQSPHKATLLSWLGQVKFMDNDNVPACWQKSEKLADDPYNSPVKWSSAAKSSKGKQYFVAYVRTHADKPVNLHPEAIVATAVAAASSDVHASPGTPGDQSADPRLQKVFIEQQSAVQGIRELVHEFSVVFLEDLPAVLPPDRGLGHAIPLQQNASVPASKIYRLSKPQREEMERQIKALLLTGWIRPSSSPYGSPILYVRKKDGSMRMYVDYRVVNKMTMKSSYTLPRIDDLLDKLSGSKIFSCLDLQQAYHQVRLHQDDVPKTAFTTPQGLFEYMVLPFGLSNAPSTFQAVINSILGPELSNCCSVYLDDIMIFSKSPEEHLLHLRMVLKKLQEANLYAKLSKCRIALTAVKFLGHVVDEHGILPGPEK